MKDIYSSNRIQAELVKTLKIPDDLHKRLAKHGSIGETFADVISNLLDYYEKANKGKI
jgi:predicted CopG family antitoxin